MLRLRWLLGDWSNVIAGISELNGSNYLQYPKQQQRRRSLS